jgi:hypothetical protein
VENKMMDGKIAMRSMLTDLDTRLVRDLDFQTKWPATSNDSS